MILPEGQGLSLYVSHLDAASILNSLAGLTKTVELLEFWLIRIIMLYTLHMCLD